MRQHRHTSIDFDGHNFVSAPDLAFNVPNGLDLMLDRLSEDESWRYTEEFQSFVRRQSFELKFTVKGVDVVVTRKRDFQGESHDGGIITRVLKKTLIRELPKLQRDSLGHRENLILMSDRRREVWIIGAMAQDRFTVFELNTGLHARQATFTTEGAEYQCRVEYTPEGHAAVGMELARSIIRSHARSHRDGIKFTVLNVAGALGGSRGDKLRMVCINSDRSSVPEMQGFIQRGEYKSCPEILKDIGVLT